MDKFQRVRSAVSIAEVVQAFGIMLEKDKALCPFHQEKTPSFSVERNKNIYHCFGCGAGGDSIDFVSKLKGISLNAAADLLTEMFNIESLNDHKNNDVKQYILSCKNNDLKTDYFANRGLTGETIKMFNLGYDESTNSVVIPYNKALTYYITRYVTEKRFSKPASKLAGAEPIFNADTLSDCIKYPCTRRRKPNMCNEYSSVRRTGCSPMRHRRRQAKSIFK